MLDTMHLGLKQGVQNEHSSEFPFYANVDCGRPLRSDAMASTTLSFFTYFLFPLLDHD